MLARIGFMLECHFMGGVEIDGKKHVPDIYSWVTWEKRPDDPGEEEEDEEASDEGIGQLIGVGREHRAG